MSFEIGQKLTIGLEVRDEAGVLTNATVAVSVLKPNMTVMSPPPTPVNDGTGLYHFDVTPDAVPGPWHWTVTTSGAVISVQRGQFWVREPGLQLISLSEVKTHLNKDLTLTSDDDELRDWIDAARYVIEREVGPVLPRTITETYSPHAQRRIHLKHGPVISITTVTETWGPGDVRVLTPDAGLTYGDNEYLYDAGDRTLVRRNSGWSTYWPSGDANVTVTYMVGRYPIPPNHKMAVAELINHLWRASQLASGATRPNPTAPDTVQLGYAIPNRVRELLGRRRAPLLGG